MQNQLGIASVCSPLPRTKLSAMIHPSTQIEISAVTESSDIPSKSVYLNSLSHPLDGMWEAFTRSATTYRFMIDGDPIGYCCVNSEKQILQFHVAVDQQPYANEALNTLVRLDLALGGFTSTADRFLLNLCLDRGVPLGVHTILYGDPSRAEGSVASHPSALLHPVTPSQLSEITQLQRNSLDQDLGDWLPTYLRNLVDRQELYSLRKEGVVLATGEIRVSDSQPPFADLGVITMREFRGQGVAGELLMRLKGLCFERQQRPICSTTIDNPAAQKAITSAGFQAKHRWLKFDL